jgi:hypothetical protein
VWKLFEVSSYITWIQAELNWAQNRQLPEYNQSHIVTTAACVYYTQAVQLCEFHTFVHVMPAVLVYTVTAIYSNDYGHIFHGVEHTWPKSRLWWHQNRQISCTHICLLFRYKKQIWRVNRSCKLNIIKWKEIELIHDVWLTLNMGRYILCVLTVFVYRGIYSTALLCVCFFNKINNTYDHWTDEHSQLIGTDQV